MEPLPWPFGSHLAGYKYNTCFSLLFSLLRGGKREGMGLTPKKRPRDRQCGAKRLLELLTSYVDRIWSWKKSTAVASTAAEQLPWAFGLHVAGYKYKITTHAFRSSRLDDVIDRGAIYRSQNKKEIPKELPFPKRNTFFPKKTVPKSKKKSSKKKYRSQKKCQKKKRSQKKYRSQKKKRSKKKCRSQKKKEFPKENRY